VQALYGMLGRQSNISAGNIETARSWTNDADVEVATLAQLVVDIGRAHARRKRRRRHIRESDPALFQRMIAAGLAFDHSAEEEVEWEAMADAVVASEPFDSLSPDLTEDDIPF
jgi:hypothetical protein